jgi:hypothetical protein
MQCKVTNLDARKLHYESSQHRHITHAAAVRTFLTFKPDLLIEFLNSYLWAKIR